MSPTRRDILKAAGGLGAVLAIAGQPSGASAAVTPNPLGRVSLGCVTLVLADQAPTLQLGIQHGGIHSLSFSADEERRAMAADLPAPLVQAMTFHLDGLMSLMSDFAEANDHG